MQASGLTLGAKMVTSFSLKSSDYFRLIWTKMKLNSLFNINTQCQFNRNPLESFGDET
jgi:hypothetical protein